MPLVISLVPVEFKGVIKQIKFQVLNLAGIKHLKLKKVDPLFSSFIPFPFLPSVEPGDREQFQCLNIAPK